MKYGICHQENVLEGDRNKIIYLAKLKKKHIISSEYDWNFKIRNIGAWVCIFNLNSKNDYSYCFVKLSKTQFAVRREIGLSIRIEDFVHLFRAWE